LIGLLGLLELRRRELRGRDRWLSGRRLRRRSDERRLTGWGGLERGYPIRELVDAGGQGGHIGHGGRRARGATGAAPFGIEALLDPAQDELAGPEPGLARQLLQRRQPARVETYRHTRVLEAIGPAAGRRRSRAGRPPRITRPGIALLETVRTVATLVAGRPITSVAAVVTARSISARASIEAHGRER
jgi:hypothetical protein